MLRGAGSIAVAACLLVASCAEEPTAPSSSEPTYTMVFFASGSASLTGQARQQITDFVSNPMGPLRTMPKAKVCVSGHSDNTGQEPMNKEFAQRRADAVAKYLVDLGVPKERLVTSSLGSSRPLVAMPPQTSQFANRRVEIVVGNC